MGRGQARKRAFARRYLLRLGRSQEAQTLVLDGTWVWCHAVARGVRYKLAGGLRRRDVQDDFQSRDWLKGI